MMYYYWMCLFTLLAHGTLFGSTSASSSVAADPHRWRRGITDATNRKADIQSNAICIQPLGQSSFERIKAEEADLLEQFWTKMLEMNPKQQQQELHDGNGNDDDNIKTAVDNGTIRRKDKMKVDVEPPLLPIERPSSSSSSDAFKKRINYKREERKKKLQQRMEPYKVVKWNGNNTVGLQQQIQTNTAANARFLSSSASSFKNWPNFLAPTPINHNNLPSEIKQEHYGQMDEYPILKQWSSSSSSIPINQQLIHLLKVVAWPLLKMVDLAIGITLLPIPGINRQILESHLPVPELLYRDHALRMIDQLLKMAPVAGAIGQFIGLLKEKNRMEFRTANLLEGIHRQIYQTQRGKLEKMQREGSPKFEFEKRMWNLKFYEGFYANLYSKFGDQLRKAIMGCEQLAKRWRNIKAFLEQNVAVLRQKIGVETAEFEQDQHFLNAIFEGNF